MHSLMQFGAKTLLEVLGSVERCSPDPRRNTSKEFFEAFRIGDKADTCYRFVSSPSPLFVGFMRQVETKPSHVFLHVRPIFNQL